MALTFEQVAAKTWGIDVVRRLPSDTRSLALPSRWSLAAPSELMYSPALSTTD